MSPTDELGGKHTAVLAEQVELKASCAPLGAARHGTNEVGAVGWHDVEQAQRATGFGAQAQPLRQRRVDVGDAPLGGDGKQSLRQAVVERQGRLKTAHRLDLARALARDVHHLPERQPLTLFRLAQRAGKGPHTDPEPAPRTCATGTWLSIELLVSGLAALGSAIEPEEGLSRVGLAGEELLQRGLPARAPAREALQRAVAIERDTLLVDNFQAVVEAVGDRLHQLGFGHAFAQAQIAKE